MPDVAGFRAKFAVIIPSTNTVMETDCARLAIPGVSFHSARMHIAHAALDSDAAFERLLREVDAAFETALRDVLTAAPDYLVMGMSAPTFWGGRAGSDAFVARAARLCGLRISTGAQASLQALAVLGAQRIAVLTPYQPIMRRQIVRYFEDCGIEVVRHVDLCCPSATAIAEVREEALIPVLRDLASAGVDAIVQAGTNLSMVRLAAEAERWLAVPVVAMNSALVWHAYRANGFTDRLYGHGPLLERF